MNIERKASPPTRQGFSLPATIVVGALAIFGAVMLVQWILASVIGLIKFALFIAIVIAVVGWVVSSKASR